MTERHYTRAFRTNNGDYLYLCVDGGVTKEVPIEGWVSPENVPTSLPYTAFRLWDIDDDERGLLVEITTQEEEVKVLKKVVDKIIFL